MGMVVQPYKQYTNRNNDYNSIFTVIVIGD